MVLRSLSATLMLALAVACTVVAQTSPQETTSLTHVTIVDVAPGKRADLVHLSADLLADIHNTTQIQAVWLRGKYFDRAALGRLLEDAKHRAGKGKLH